MINTSINPRRIYWIMTCLVNLIFLPLLPPAISIITLHADLSIAIIIFWPLALAYFGGIIAVNIVLYSFFKESVAKFLSSSRIILIVGIIINILISPFTLYINKALIQEYYDYRYSKGIDLVERNLPHTEHLSDCEARFNVYFYQRNEIRPSQIYACFDTTLKKYPTNTRDEYDYCLKTTEEIATHFPKDKNEGKGLRGLCINHYAIALDDISICADFLSDPDQNDKTSLEKSKYFCENEVKKIHNGTIK